MNILILTIGYSLGILTSIIVILCKLNKMKKQIQPFEFEEKNNGD